MKNYLNQDFTKIRYNEKLDPWAVTGLCDSEGSFTCNVSKTDKGITGYSIKLEFKVTQKRHSEGILYELRDFFGCGTVVIDNRNSDTKKYHVTGLQAIFTKIIPHFNSYPCLTSKQLNFNDWERIALLLSKKEHLSLEGLKEVIKIDNGLNSKRTFEEKYHFCKNSLNLQKNGESHFDLSPHWVQAFLSGESVFYNYIAEKKSRGKIYQSPRG